MSNKDNLTSADILELRIENLQLRDWQNSIVVEMRNLCDELVSMPEKVSGDFIEGFESAIGFVEGAREGYESARFERYCAMNGDEERVN